MSRSSRGVTLIELVFVLGIVGMGIVIFLPELLRARDQARKSQCQLKLQQIADANLSYEAINRVFPAGRGYPDWERGGFVMRSYSNYDQLQLPGDVTRFYPVHLWLLPHLDMQCAFDLFDFDQTYVRRIALFGTIVNPNYDAIVKVGNFFVCPDDPNTTPGGVAENNYRYNFGGSLPYGGAFNRDHQDNITAEIFGQFPVAGNGAYTIGKRLGARAFPRGLSHVAFFSERTKGSGQSLKRPTIADLNFLVELRQPAPTSVVFPACAALPPKGVNGFNFNSPGRFLEGSDYSYGWPFAGYDATEYNHVAPPNWVNRDCSWGIPQTPGEHAIISARSSHGGKSQGTVNVAFGDGHVESVSGQIDLNVWRRMGVRDGLDRVKP